MMKKFLTMKDPSPPIIPKGFIQALLLYQKGSSKPSYYTKGFSTLLATPEILPSWLTEEDIEYFASKFSKTGFTGGFNYYRALDLTWELTGPWSRGEIKVPAKFIVGDLDLVYDFPGAKEYIHGGGFKKDVPLLEDVVVIEGAAHFINQEKADEISSHL
ncbi:hypothetical protein Csa_015387 [Cucumis sativus]|nr:hypothetical protein Csa_015387 [Cucumis sativus]